MRLAGKGRIDTTYPVSGLIMEETEEVAEISLVENVVRAECTRPTRWWPSSSFTRPGARSSRSPNASGWPR